MELNDKRRQFVGRVGTGVGNKTSQIVVPGQDPSYLWIKLLIGCIVEMEVDRSELRDGGTPFQGFNRPTRLSHLHIVMACHIETL